MKWSVPHDVFEGLQHWKTLYVMFQYRYCDSGISETELCCLGLEIRLERAQPAGLPRLPKHFVMESIDYWVS